MAALDVTKHHPPLPERNAVDTDNLSSSHFTLGHDYSTVKECMKSIFKLDYPAPSDPGRVQPSDPPALGEVMHKDTKFFRDNLSETINSFQYRHLPKPELQYDHDTIGKTNFKMDSDVSKINSFRTIHRLHFPSLMGPMSPVVRCSNGSKLYTSCIPQGDPDKEHLHMSDYKDKFKGHDTRIQKVPRATSTDDGGLPTIKGDTRLAHFNTSNADSFQGMWLPRVPALPVPRIISVPQGDPEKVATKSTTMWDSYPKYSQQNGFDLDFDLEKATRKMRRTNHHDKDGHDSWNDFATVTKNAFPQKQSAVERFRPAVRRNHSDFPHGDLDPERSLARVSNTTNNFHFGKPALNHVNPILAGSDFITQSKLIFGEPRLRAQYYDTCTSQTYVPKAGHTRPVPKGRGTRSVMPFDYPTEKPDEATTSHDFQNPRKGRLRPNPEMIQSLSEHHIRPPQKEHDFLTTHKDTFVAKTSVRESIDPHKLQVSSVPLGTLLTQEPKYGDTRD